MFNNFFHKYVSLQYDNRKTFIICQWQHNLGKTSRPYLVYRWIVTLYYIIATNCCLALDEGSVPKWLLKYGNLSLFVCAISAFWVSMLFSKYQLKVRSDDMNSSNVPLKLLSSYKFYWWSNVVAINSALLAEVCRFTTSRLGASFKYTTELELTELRRTEDPTMIPYVVKHMCLAVTIVDFMMVSHGVRIFHVVYMLMWNMLYTIFTAIYWACGGTNDHGRPYIYSSLQWGTDPIGALKTSSLYIAYTVVIHMTVHSYISSGKALIHTLPDHCTANWRRIVTTNYGTSFSEDIAHRL